MKTFSFSRVGALLRYDSRMFGPKVLLLYLAFLLFATVVGLLIGYRHALGFGMVVYITVMPIVFMGVAVEIICRKFVKADTATAYAMLPATVLEKWSVVVLEVLLCVGGASVVICNVALCIIQIMVTLAVGDSLSGMQLELFHPLCHGDGFNWLKHNLVVLCFLIFVVFAFKCRLRHGAIAMTVILIGELVAMALGYSGLLNVVGFGEPRLVFRSLLAVVVPMANVALLYYTCRLVRTHDIC